MPAIWGCVNLSGQDVPPGVIRSMQKPFEGFCLDRIACQTHANAAMGCGLQYITPQAQNEPMPILDEEAGLFFAADVYLCNRDELIEQLCPGEHDIPDGRLFYLGYKRWRDDAPKHIYGSYAYAIYDFGQNRLILGADHTISRSLYYYRQGETVYFSTLVEPMYAGMAAQPQLNETWMALFLALNTYTILTDTTSTPYKGVFRVEAAHYQVFTPASSHSVAYWTREQVQPLRLGSDQEYKARFRELMELCTRQMLRTNAEVAIHQSSGLDSSSVAAYAAPLLAARNKQLYAYTHVPIKAFRKQNTARQAFNESEGVLRLCGIYPNIVPHFLSTPQCNGVLSLGKLMPYGMFPMKSTTNLGWIDALMAEAAHDGCRIMLSGQYGNVTISRGSMETYLTTVLLQGQFNRFWKGLYAYSRTVQVGRRRILRYLLEEMRPLWLKRLLCGDYLKQAPVNRHFALQAGLSARDRRLERDRHVLPASTFQRENSYVYDMISLAHVSDTETRFSLRYGMQTLDVTRDIRIIEFCLGLPMECFCSCDPTPSTRRLVRVYLEDLLPKEILAEMAPRGRQSADSVERLQSAWPRVQAELERVCLSPEMLRMADEQKVRQMLKQLCAHLDEETLVACRPLLYIYAAGTFLGNHQWQA